MIFKKIKEQTIAKQKKITWNSISKVFSWLQYKYAVNDQSISFELYKQNLL